MDCAYAAADVVISRAGALSVAELCLVGKPVILMPSPNVAEDHQTKNAQALVDKGAAIMVKDAEAPEILIQKVFEILNDKSVQQQLGERISQLALPDADQHIAEEIIQLAENQ